MVPMLIYGDQVFSESEIINWLVCEDFEASGTPLIPNNSTDKFKMRWFIKNFAAKLVTAFYSPKGMNKKSE